MTTVAPPALSAAESKTAGAEAEIRAVAEQAREAVKARAAERLLEMYTPDAQLIAPGKTLTGRGAVRAQIASAFAAGLSDVRLEEQEFFVGDGIAVEIGRATFSGTAVTNPIERRYMTLWKKGDDGRWRIHRDIGVPATVGAEAQGPRQSGVEFAIKQVEPCSAIVLPMTGSYSQHGEAIGRVAASLGGPPSGPPFGRYYNSPENVAEAELKWEVGFTVPSNITIQAPFELREFPAETVVFAVVDGSHEASRPWRELVEWALGHGYEITGPAMEVWMDGPKTEMRLPVRK